MAEKEGFEPPQVLTSSGFRNRPLQPLGYFSTKNDYSIDKKIAKNF